MGEEREGEEKEQARGGERRGRKEGDREIGREGRDKRKLSVSKEREG